MLLDQSKAAQVIDNDNDIRIRECGHPFMPLYTGLTEVTNIDGSVVFKLTDSHKPSSTNSRTTWRKGGNEVRRQTFRDNELLSQEALVDEEDIMRVQAKVHDYIPKRSIGTRVLQMAGIK